ncbi:alpha/beta fold hydrolase [Sphingomonas edaphi]|uniref:Alpha/beta fold hydrolase n=1 Tax=Sphingomonas edaphi TaxID=2315689 RepID=A0A418PZD8_9SPHN|nr:alpha/beta fold hydrolase [Sphingomonas edaphi]RIX29097.1 alpha/beta fold hydrolase [Sphingomonas edaphi]
MGNLFLSYARDDRPVADRLGVALEAAGHRVWWDRQLSGGSQFSTAIEQELDRADHVLVLWSRDAVQSPWVRDEAAYARDAGKLIPLTLDGGPSPLGFRQFHTVDASNWVNGSNPGLPDGLEQALGTAPAADASERPKQRVQFCRTSDGVTLAYSKVGSGTPLLKSANWLNHLEYEWGNPLWRHWIDEFSECHTLVRYDERCNGMSDWDAPTLSFSLLVEDLLTVADAAGLQQFDLLAISQGCPVAVAFAVRYPERVRRLVMINGFAAGWAHSRDPEQRAQWDALATLARTGWGKDNAVFRQTFTNLFFPEATAQQSAWWNELQKLSASPKNAERLMRLFGEIDVGDLLPQVRAPTLVLHCQNDQLVPLEAGRLMASRIPDAQFVALDSHNHLVLQNEPAWLRLVAEVTAFLCDQP